MAEPMAFAQPKCSGFRTDAAPRDLLRQNDGAAADEDRRRLSAFETFMASTAVLNQRADGGHGLVRNLLAGCAAAFDVSPSSTMPSRTAMSVAVITSPPNTRAFFVIS